MKRIVRKLERYGSLLIAFLGSLCYSLPDPEEFEPAAGSVEELQRILDDVRRSTGVPGISGSLIHGDDWISASSGFLRRDGDVKLNNSHLMHLGSVTKGFTALLIATLVEEGHLRFDMTLSEALPGWTIHPGLRDVTIHQVLTNQSGLIGFHDTNSESKEDVAYLTVELPAAEPDPVKQRKAMAEYLLSRPPAYEPGSRALYSNPGWCILGVIAEQRLGKAYESLLQEKVLDPLGIRSARFGGWPNSSDDIQPAGHYFKSDECHMQRSDDPFELPAWMNPAGGLQLNIDDFSRYVLANLQGLRAESAEYSAIHSVQIRARISQMYSGEKSNQEVAYGYGWGLVETDRGILSAGEGSGGTFYASIMVFPYLNVAVVTTTNCGNSDVFGKVVKKLTGIPWG